MCTIYIINKLKDFITDRKKHVHKTLFSDVKFASPSRSCSDGKEPSFLLFGFWAIMASVWFGFLSISSVRFMCASDNGIYLAQHVHEYT